MFPPHPDYCWNLLIAAAQAASGVQSLPDGRFNQVVGDWSLAINPGDTADAGLPAKTIQAAHCDGAWSAEFWPETYRFECDHDPLFEAMRAALPDGHALKDEPELPGAGDGGEA